MSTIVNDLVSYLVCGEAISANDAIYIDDVSGKIFKYDVSDDTQVFAGIAKEAGILDDFVRVVQSGRVKGFSGLTAGQFVYASVTTPGGFQTVDPGAASRIILGIAKSATELVINGGLGIKPGGEGSGGGLDVYYTENMEGLNDVSDFSTGNNAAFLGGGTMQGTLALDSVSPISGTKSLTYTQAAGSLNDYFASELIDIDLKQQNNDSGMTLYFTYDGDDDDLKFVVYDVTNSVELTSGVELVKTNSTAKRYALSFYSSNTTAQIRWGAQVLVENDGAELVVDDVEITSNPFVYKDLAFENDFTVNIENDGVTASAKAGERSPNRQWWDSITRTGLGDVTIDFTSLGLSQIPHITGATNAPSDTNIGVLNATLTSVRIFCRDLSTENPKDADFNILLTKQGSDYEAPSEHVITPAKSTLTDWTAFTPTGSWTTNTTYSGFYRRVGDSAEIQYRVDLSGTPNAGVILDFDMISGLSVDTSKLTGSDIHSGVSGQISDGGIVLPLTADYLDSLSGFRVRFHQETNETFNIISYTGLSTTNYTGGTLDSGDFIEVTVSVPISEWSSDATFLAAIPTPKTAYIKDVKPSGTDGGTFTSGSWQTRDLNTLEGDTGFVSLSSNQVTLSPGKYEIEASAPARQVNRHQIRLRNITDSIDDGVGDAQFSGSNDGTTTSSDINTTLTITSSKTFEVQHQCQSTNTGNGFGNDVNFGLDSIYTTVKITKVG